ncbi:hypothetical protein CCP3SC15_1060001 [Gammaproteobacteria bacterium]
MRERRLNPEEIEVERKVLVEDLEAGRLYPHEAAKRMRRILGLRQGEFARLAQVAERTYALFERGSGNVTVDTLRKIGGLFGFDVKFGRMGSLHDQGVRARAQYRELRKLRTDNPRPRRTTW